MNVYFNVNFFICGFVCAPVTFNASDERHISKAVCCDWRSSSIIVRSIVAESRNTTWNMTTKQVVAFSKLCEQFLFCDLLASCPKFKVKYAANILLSAITLLKHIHYATLSNADIVDHVKHGNIWPAIGDNFDSGMLCATIVSFELITVQLLSSYFIKDERIVFVRQFIANSFLSLSRKLQITLVTVMRVCKYVSLVTQFALFAYFTHRILTTFETSCISRLQAIASCCLITNLGYNFLMALLLVSVAIWLTCRNLVQRLRFTLKVICWKQRPPVAKLLQLINNDFVVIDKLNHYWKSVIFLMVVTNSLTIATAVTSITVSHLPSTVIAMALATVAFLAFNVSLQILLPAMVHSQLKQFHNNLNTNCAAYYHDQMTIGFVLKRFEHLKAFTMLDVAPITLDLYREVQIHCSSVTVALIIDK